MTDTGPDAPGAFIGKALHDGRYVVSGVLGEGAQGATLEAIDKRDGTLVAIKRFQVRGARSWKDVELAEREARVLKRLSHDLLPGGMAHFEEDGALYLVMERIEGNTLAKEGKLDRNGVIRFLHDADRVLHYLHNQSPPVVHRDIKPSNVILRPSKTGPPTHVLVDFGSVRDTLKPAGGSTVVGTFGYMAPEQFQGRARPQSDVYAVGATAIRMLTGLEPEDLPHKGLAIDVRAALPHDPPMAELLERLLEPDPDVRPTRILPLLQRLTPQAPTPQRAHAEPTKRRSRRHRRHDKRERRRQKRDERRRGWSSGERRPVPPLILPIVVLALAIARVAVNLSLRVLVPTVLTLLSLIFGKNLRRAARAVGRAGVVADGAMHNATLWVMGRQKGETETAHTNEPEGQRIDVEPPKRVAPLDEARQQAQDEVAAAIEEVAHEIDAFRGPPKRKHHNDGDDRP